MQPMMYDHQIKILEKILHDFNLPHLDILEWGCGGSTSYFTNYLKKRNISYNWISIEHNRAWYEKISTLLKEDKNIHFKFFDIPLNRDALKKESMDEYINYPLTLKKKFDLILVDGRKRKRCLLTAAGLLKPHGIVLLHDAHRKRYRKGFKPYSEKYFLEHGLWLGSMHTVSIIDRVYNILNNMFYRYLYKRLPKRIKEKWIKNIVANVEGDVKITV